MTITPEVAPPPTAKSTTRFGARAVLAAISLALVAIPGALTLLLVKDRWTPLLRADNGARDRLHDFAVTHTGFVGTMQLISESGSAAAWSIVHKSFDTPHLLRGDRSEVETFGEELSNETVGVFVRTTLVRTTGIGEV